MIVYIPQGTWTPTTVSEEEAVAMQKQNELSFLPEYFPEPTDRARLREFCQEHQGYQIWPIDNPDLDLTEG